VVAIEKDDELFDLLKTKFEKEVASGQLILIHDDILNFEPEKFNLDTGKYKLIANIPYNLTGIILRKFLETNIQPEKIVLLVQKEVAERIVGSRRHGVSAGEKIKESVLSISVKTYGIPRYVETVKAGSFAPMPKVNSAIIIVDKISKEFFQQIIHDTPPVDTECLQGGCVEKEFFELVRGGFRSKRKKLSSNLSTVFEKSKIKKVFTELNLDESLRAEDVKIETWQKLAQHLLL